MRRLSFTAALVATSFAASAFAQGAPAFRPLSSEEGMVVNTAPALSATTSITTDSQQPAVEGSMIAPMPHARNGDIIDSKGGNAIPALPMQVVRVGNIAYISGGIGDEEIAQLKAQEHLYNFRIQIANKAGEYMTDVTFNVYDSKGKQLVSIDDAGPYVMMQLPFANFEGEVISSVGKERFKFKLPPNKVVKKQIRL